MLLVLFPWLPELSFKVKHLLFLLKGTKLPLPPPADGSSVISPVFSAAKSFPDNDNPHGKVCRENRHIFIPVEPMTRTSAHPQHTQPKSLYLSGFNLLLFLDSNPTGS